MFRFILFLILIACLGIGIFWLSLNSGSLSFTILDYTVETKVIYAVGAFIIAVLLFNFVLELFHKIVSLPSVLKSVFAEKRKDKKEQLLLELIGHLFQQDNQQIANVAKSLAKSSLPEKISDQLKAASFLSSTNSQAYKTAMMALLKYSDLQPFVYTQLIEVAMKEEDWVAGCSFSAELWRIKKDGATARKFIIMHYNAGRWQEILEFLKQFRLNWLLKRSSRQALEGVVCFAIAEHEFMHGLTAKAEQYFGYAIDCIPEFIPAFKRLIDIKIQSGLIQEAAKLLELAWRHNPHHTYGMQITKLATYLTAVDFYKTVRRIVAKNSCHYESHLIMAEAALANSQFDIASKEISQALNHQNEKRALQLMARFCLLTQGNTLEALQWLKKANEADSDIHGFEYYLDYEQLQISSIVPKNGVLIARV